MSSIKTEESRKPLSICHSGNMTKRSYLASLGDEPQICLDPCNLGVSPSLSASGSLPVPLAFFLGTSESVGPLTKLHLPLPSPPRELICEYCALYYPVSPKIVRSICSENQTMPNGTLVLFSVPKLPESSSGGQRPRRGPSQSQDTCVCCEADQHLGHSTHQMDIKPSHDICRSDSRVNPVPPQSLLGATGSSPSRMQCVP